MSEPLDGREHVRSQMAHLAMRTVAISKSLPGREDHIGSGVLLRVSESFFIVTAAHVGDDVMKRWKGVCLNTDTIEKEPIPLHYKLGAMSKKGEDPNREDDTFDIAVFELSEKTVELVADFGRFASLSDVELRPDRLKDGWYAFVGYPGSGERFDHDPVEETIIVTSLPFITHLHDSGSFAVDEYNGDIHLALDVSHPREINGEMCGFDLDVARGISGCGVWRLLDPDEPIESMDWREFKLVGIVAGRADFKPGHTTQVLLATKSVFVLDLLWNGWPNLRQEISRHFPGEFPSV